MVLWAKLSTLEGKLQGTATQPADQLPKRSVRQRRQHRRAASQTGHMWRMMYQAAQSLQKKNRHCTPPNPKTTNKNE
jgi:hypothetical protein